MLEPSLVAISINNKFLSWKNPARVTTWRKSECEEFIRRPIACSVSQKTKLEELEILCEFQP